MGPQGPQLRGRQKRNPKWPIFKPYKIGRDGKLGAHFWDWGAKIWSYATDHICTAEHHSSRYCHITLVLTDLHWLPVRHRIDFKIATTAFKVLHHQQPLYLAQILPRYTPSRSLRSSSSITISAPLRKTSMATSKSFSSTASRVWNRLPTHVSSASTLPVFRGHFKHHFFLDAYPGFTAPTIKIESIMPST